MAHGFGNLFKMRNIRIYSLSPFEQKVFAKIFSHAIPNTIRRLVESTPYVVPPFVLGYLYYLGVEVVHEKYMRKNPADYENDE